MNFRKSSGRSLARLSICLAVIVAAFTPWHQLEASALPTVLLLVLLLGLAAIVSATRGETNHKSDLDQESAWLHAHRTLAATLSDAVATTDSAGRIDSFNAEAERLSGWSRDQALGNRFHEIFHVQAGSTPEPLFDPDKPFQPARNFTRAILIDRNGVQRNIDGATTSIRNDEGKYLGMLFRCRETVDSARDDVDSPMRGVQMTASDGLETLIHNAPAFICTLRGPDHVFELVNLLYLELVGGRELIGKPAREALPELEGRGFFDLLDQVYRSGDSYVGKEVPIDLQRGGRELIERRIINFVYQAMREADGTVWGIFVHGVDVTDLVSAREVVRDSEVRFRQLADAMPQAVWTASADGTVDYLNRKWREYGDYPEGSIGEGLWAQILHPDDLEPTRESWNESIRSGCPFEMEHRIRRQSDDTYRWHLCRALPVEDSRGRIVRWFGTSTDVDDVKRLAEALAQADRRKDEFLATLAHELRNPLAPIRNGLQILRSHPSRETSEATVEMMARQIGHMVRLIDELMDVARVGSGKIVLRRERTILQAVAAGAIEACRQQIETAGHHLSLSVPDDPILLDADPTRLTQVLSNLLNNAAKYTERGGRIELNVAREAEEAVVRVRDDGVGLAPEMLPRVFEMFTQVDESLARSQGGLGIGLTIVKRLVELHGGRIEAYSEGVGRGSEFVVRLPVAATTMSDVGASAPDQMRRIPATGLRILVVDDNRDSANSLSRLLAMDGHDVETAYDGPQTLDRVAARPSDLILLDLGLPGKNGFEVAVELRAIEGARDALLVALTGWGQDADRRRSREAGFDHHLVKPVDLDALRNVIAMATRRLEAAVAVRDT